MSDRSVVGSALDVSLQDEYARLWRKHQRCAERLDELQSRFFLSEQEKVEEVNLKKQKLQLKDRMAAITRPKQDAEVPGPG